MQSHTLERGAGPDWRSGRAFGGRAL